MRAWKNFPVLVLQETFSHATSAILIAEHSYAVSLSFQVSYPKSKCIKAYYPDLWKYIRKLYNFWHFFQRTCPHLEIIPKICWHVTCKTSSSLSFLLGQRKLSQCRSWNSQNINWWNKTYILTSLFTLNFPRIFTMSEPVARATVMCNLQMNFRDWTNPFKIFLQLPPSKLFHFH